MIDFALTASISSSHASMSGSYNVTSAGDCTSDMGTVSVESEIFLGGSGAGPLAAKPVKTNGQRRGTAYFAV
jgi:hypothetical protein